MGAAMLDFSMLETSRKASSQQLPQELLQGIDTPTTTFALPQVQDVGPDLCCCLGTLFGPT